MDGPRQRVIVTGGRHFGEHDIDERAFVSRTLYRELRVSTAWAHDSLLVVVGDCPTGVDYIVRTACRTWGLKVKVYRADWRREGKQAGPNRNGRMVDDGAIRLIAFPGGPGTADCTRKAGAAGIPIAVFRPELTLFA